MFPAAVLQTHIESIQLAKMGVDFYYEVLTGNAMCLSEICALTRQENGCFWHFLTAVRFELLQGSHETRGSSHSELWDERLQVTGCTPPTSQVANSFLCAFLSALSCPVHSSKSDHCCLKN